MSEINEVKELISQTKGAVGIMTKVSLLEYFITTIESQNNQIESLKAITELAVKGLKEIEASQYTLSSKVRTTAISYLNEIERLSHELDK